MVEVENQSSMVRCKTTTQKTLESNEGLSGKEAKLKSLFVELLSIFLKGTCSNGGFKPLPPMLGNGHSVDLLKLYCIVKQKGGFEAVSKNGLWGEVGSIYGVGSTLGSAMKLIYLKYLEALESCLVKSPVGCNSKRVWPSNLVHSDELSMEFQAGFSSLMSSIMDEISKISEHYVGKTEKTDMNFVDLTNDDMVDKKFRKKMKLGFADVVDLTEGECAGGKLKRKKKTDSGFASDVDLTGAKKKVKRASDEDLNEVKKDSNKLEKIHSEVSFADFISRNVSDAKRFSVEAENAIMSSENSDASQRCCTPFGDKSTIVDASMLKEEVCSCERVRHSGLSHDDGKLDRARTEMSFAADDASPEASGTRAIKEEVSSNVSERNALLKMLSWMAKVSKDPTDPGIGAIPESSKWGSFGDEHCWKQVLLAREALFLKKKPVEGSEQLIWQRKQRMHPSMFDDHIKVAERSSPRLLTAITRYPNQRKVSRHGVLPNASLYTSRPQQRIPVGRPFQAEVPEWTGVTAESDPKWLGTKVWPLERRRQHNSNSLIERDPIGKGRVDACACQQPGSSDCVRFHISERRKKTKLELGPLFYTWNFHKMGEQCSLSWTSEEENTFRSVLKENKCFWDKLRADLPNKSRPEQVNYYFNVFKLQRRGGQNRLSVCDIDSDDDETEYRVSS